MDFRSLLNNAQSSLSNTYDSSIENMIDRLGLQRRRSATDSLLPALGVFGAGVAVGAALGLIFAPKRGEELREDITDQLDHLKDRIDHLSAKSRRQYEELLSRGGELIESTREDLGEVAERVSQKANKAAEAVSDVAKKVAGDVEQGVKKTADKIEDGVKEAAEAAKDVKQAAEKQLDKAKN